ncbi:MAG TPA: hypothetical protein DCO75_08550 [Fibrobacteres bacterium]|nr:hypothetical protein [Fibrobacterota bacterium]
MKKKLFLLALIITFTVCNNKSTDLAPVPAKTVHFSHDTLFCNALFTDTIHAESLSVTASKGNSLSFHFIDSRSGMSVTDSVFSWTPTDTGTIIVNGTICGDARCDTLRDTLYVIYASSQSRIIHFNNDTLTCYVKFIDTLRPDSESMARFGSKAFSFHFIDSSKTMILHDSVFSWTPLDTGIFKVVISQCGSNGRCDTLKGALHIVNGQLPRAYYKFRKDTVCLNSSYKDTLRAANFSDPTLKKTIKSFLIPNPLSAMTLSDSIFFWIPRDSGCAVVNFLACDTGGVYYSVTDSFTVNYCSPYTCPSYTHKDDIVIGNQADLPAGFFVYSYEYSATNPIYGLYISDIQKFSPAIIPGTETETPRSLKISDDGKWILYANNYDAYIVSVNGAKKYKVPLSESNVLMVDFFRNGPNGTEICYTTTDTVRQEIFAIQVTLDTVPVFGSQRKIADLTGSFRIDPWYNFSVVKDQIFGSFSILHNGTYRLRAGFVTIPNAGAGIAYKDNMYKWKNDTAGREFYGCNMCMSHDGSQCIYIPGEAGDVGQCVPINHQGFVITPFRRDSDPAITIDDHINVYGTSVNFCPPAYRYGTWDQMDFHGWYFGNRNDLAIGCLAGTRAPVKCVWMVDWNKSVWTMLTPADSSIPVNNPAVYFTGTDTGNTLDPYYKVVSPNGGEQFVTGQACTVTVTAKRDANAGIRLKVDNGKYSFLVPGMTESINPHVDSVFIFTIPEYFKLAQYNESTQSIDTVQISSVSDSCSICVLDYTASTGFGDCSDSVFSIKSAKH